MIDAKFAPQCCSRTAIGLGIMFLARGLLLKAFVFTLPGTAQFFESIGLPGPLAYMVFAAESVGGLLLIFGIYARWVAGALTPILIGALLVHVPNDWVFSAAGGGCEYHAFLILASGALSLLGDGALSPRLPPLLQLVRLHRAG